MPGWLVHSNKHQHSLRVFVRCGDVLLLVIRSRIIYQEGQLGWGHPQNLLACGLAEVLRKLWGILIEPYSRAQGVLVGGVVGGVGALGQRRWMEVVRSQLVEGVVKLVRVGVVLANNNPEVPNHPKDVKGLGSVIPCSARPNRRPSPRSRC